MKYCESSTCTQTVPQIVSFLFSLIVLSSALEGMLWTATNNQPSNASEATTATCHISLAGSNLSSVALSDFETSICCSSCLQCTMSTMISLCAICVNSLPWNPLAPTSQTAFRSLSIDSGLSFRMSRIPTGGRVKMLRCSSSHDKNAVLMSPDTSFHMCDATDCKVEASACADSVDLSRGTSVRRSWNPKTQRRALGLAVDFHVNTHRAPITRSLSATFLVTASKTVTQPRLQLCLLCSAKEFPVLIRHLQLVHFNSLLVPIRYGEDLQHP